MSIDINAVPSSVCHGGLIVMLDHESGCTTLYLTREESRELIAEIERGLERAAKELSGEAAV